MIYRNTFLVSIIVFLCVIYTTNLILAETSNEKYKTISEMANMLLQNSFANNQAKGPSGGKNIDINGMAQAFSSLLENDGSKSTGDGSGAFDAAQILDVLSQMMNANSANAVDGAEDLDLAQIGNLINMFTSANDDKKSQQTKRRKHRTHGSIMDSEIDTGIASDSILNIASSLMNNVNSEKANEAFTNLLPMAIQLMNSFSDGDGGKNGNINFQGILQLLPEEVKVVFGQFLNAKFVDTLWQKSSLKKLFSDFYDRDGKFNYEKFLEALNNQTFRRRWINSSIGNLSEWAKYLANPSIYKRYMMSTQIMFNGLLTVLEAPSRVLFDPNRPTQSIANALDFLFHKYMHMKMSTIDHVRPVVAHIQHLMKLAREQDFLRQIDTPEFREKMTDIINLEVIEPFLKVFRAYRFASKFTECDKYVLCKINAHNSEETLHLTGFKDTVMKVGSIGAAWVIANQNGTPFRTIINVIMESHKCTIHYRPECSGFHEEEEKTKIEFIHNEL